jgi:DNA-directed RNA polymerase specialized sigma24 family protein
MIDRDELEAFLQSDQCTDKEREAFDLAYVQRLGIRKAARQLGISPRSVRDRLDNVKDKLNKEGLEL